MYKKILCAPWRETPYGGTWDLYYAGSDNLFCIVMKNINEKYSITYTNRKYDYSRLAKEYPTLEAAQLAVEQCYDIKVLTKEEYKRLVVMR